LHAGLPQNPRARQRSSCRKPLTKRNQPHIRPGRGTVRDPARLSEPGGRGRSYDPAVRPSSRPAAGAPGGKASRLPGSRVRHRNTGTRGQPPVASGPASSLESGEGCPRGRSPRSSPGSGKPATWRRGAGSQGLGRRRNGQWTLSIKPIRLGSSTFNASSTDRKARCRTKAARRVWEQGLGKPPQVTVASAPQPHVHVRCATHAGATHITKARVGN
jgi:hypothetical protein